MLAPASAARTAGPPDRRSSHRLACRRAPRAAFTLTELVVVMTVVGILTGAAVGSMSSLQSSRQNVAATRVRSALVFAQDWARDSGLDTWVAFDIGADRVTLHVEDRASPGTANRLPLTDPLRRTAMEIQLGGDGVELVSASFGGTTEVQFDELGVPRDANGVELTADGSVVLTGSVALCVTRNTGLVTVD